MPSVQNASVTTGELLRRLMRQVATPVAVITTCSTEEARGMTANSVTSVSMVPPLVSFNVGRGSRMQRAVADASYFAVHLLGDDQASLARHFARPRQSGAQQFENIAHRFHCVYRVPMLANPMGILFCRPLTAIQAGDHDLIVGRVVELASVRHGKPLLYYQRNYCTVDATTCPFARSEHRTSLPVSG